jgi:hypothetical protein
MLTVPAMSERIDPGHSSKRRRISAISVVLLVVGFAIAAYGLMRFGSNFLRPSSEFFADPDRVMDESRSNGFIGIISMFVGGTMAMFGARGMFFARAGSVLRYAAAETAPVAADTFDYLADETQDGVEKVTRAIRKGAGQGTGGGEVIKVRCRACGYLESEDAKFCSGCGKSI